MLRLGAKAGLVEEGAGGKGGKQLVGKGEGRPEARGAGSLGSRLLPVSSQDGVWVRGLYLEGAGWDWKNSCLVEADPMQLVCLMPTIHFRPAESRKKSAKGGVAPRVWIPTPPLPRPSPHTCACSPRGPGALTPIPSPFPQACTPVPAITIPTGQAAQTEPPSSLASTSGPGPWHLITGSRGAPLYS